MKHLLRVLIIFLGVVAVLGVAIVACALIVAFAPYQPTPEEARQHFLSRDDTLLNDPMPDVYTDAQVTHVLPALPDAQVVIGNWVRQVPTDPVETIRCLRIEYVTKHWFLGTRDESHFQGCYSDGVAPPIHIQTDYEQDTYLAAGLTADSRVTAVTSHWQDGSELTQDTVDGIFIFVEHSDMEVEWIVGQNAAGEILSDTISYNESINLTIHDYATVRQIPLDRDVAVMGVYGVGGAFGRDCLQLSYLQVNEAESYLSGEREMNGYYTCFHSPRYDPVIGPTTVLVIENYTLFAGYTAHPDVAAVQVQWSGGAEDILPVENGFFFSRHNFLVLADSIQPLDNNGNLLNP